MMRPGLLRPSSRLATLTVSPHRSKASLRDPMTPPTAVAPLPFAHERRRMKVASVHIYPVKSLAGLSVVEAQVEPWGLRHDRRWAVLDPDGARLSAREEHRLLGLTATPTNGGVEIKSRDGLSLAVQTPVAGELVPTTISRLEWMRLAADEAHVWLSGLLERPVRLGWLDDPRRRSVSEAHGGLPTDTLNLADAGPLLLTTTSSLKQLNDWMVADALARGAEPPSQMEMARFRPSVVVDEVREAFEEDGWRTLRIGAADFRFAERCDRCVMTTLDPRTLVGGKEPLRTLAAHRQWDHKTWFGVRVVPLSPGVISVGDAVGVLTRA